MPVQLTLNTGKVYAGLFVSVLDPSREPGMVDSVPILSG
jgi:hypothetical protein